jgi:anti-anti-sigma regulatory factor
MQYPNQDGTIEIGWQDASEARGSNRMASTKGPAELRLAPNSILVRPLGPTIDRDEASAIAGLVASEYRDRRSTPKRLLVDFSAVSVPSSMAIGLLLELGRMAEEQGSDPHLHASRRMLEVLRMLRLDGRYTMVVSERRLVELLR